jgi:outer membrane protein
MKKILLITWLVCFCKLALAVSLDEVLERNFASFDEIKREDLNIKKYKLQAWNAVNVLPTVTASYQRFKPFGSEIIGGQIPSGLPLAVFTPNPRHTFQISATLDLSYYKLIPQVMQAKNLLEAQKKGSEQNKEQFKIDIVQAFLNLLYNSKLTQLADKRVDLARKIFEIEEIRFKNKTYKTVADFEQASADFLSAKNNKTQAYQALNESQEVYKNKLGQLDTDLKMPDIQAYQVPFESFDALLAAVKKSNKNLQNLEYVIKANKQASLASKADFLPQISVSVAQNRLYNDLQALPSYSQNSVSLNVSVPLFEGGKGFTRAAAENYNQQISVLSHKIASKNTREEALKLWNKTKSLIEEIFIQEKVVKAYQTTVQIKDIQYANKIISASEFFESQIDLENAKLMLVSLKKQYILNIFLIKFISGLTI